jgi:hypothetical protein
MDETSKQLLRDTRRSLPMEPGRVEREDYEYERGGVANVFMFLGPLAGRRWIGITEHRTKRDWARQIEELVDVRYPEAERTVLVMDNLTTHTPASLYEAFCPEEEARRIAQKPEIHYTPKHGSWLNMAEIELSVLSRQCLERRVPDFETLQRAKRRLGSIGATPRASRSTGASPRRMLASSSSAPILHFRSNIVLLLNHYDCAG